MFQPEFAAVCDTCGATTLWFKANKVAEGEGGRPAAIKGFKCAQCESFETKVLDTRGTIRERG